MAVSWVGRRPAGTVATTLRSRTVGEPVPSPRHEGAGGANIGRVSSLPPPSSPPPPPPLPPPSTGWAGTVAVPARRDPFVLSLPPAPTTDRWRPFVQWFLAIPHLIVAWALSTLRNALTLVLFF